MGSLSHPETWWSQEGTVISNFRWAASKARKMFLKNIAGKHWEIPFLSRRHYPWWTAAAPSHSEVLQKMKRWVYFFPPLLSSMLACPMLSVSLLAEMRPSRYLAGSSGAVPIAWLGTGDFCSSVRAHRLSCQPDQASCSSHFHLQNQKF